MNGRWSWASGCTAAAYLGVGIKVDDGSAESGLPRMAVIPRESATIVDNWDVNGLRGTGSHDIEVTGLVVPEDWTFIRGGASSLDTPLFRYPTLAIASQVLAVVGLGAARGHSTRRPPWLASGPRSPARRGSPIAPMCRSSWPGPKRSSAHPRFSLRGDRPGL